MDKRAGSSWHVVVGEGFGFEITHEMKNLLYMFFGGNLVNCLFIEGVLVWKAS
jgi:dynein light chain 4